MASEWVRLTPESAGRGGTEARYRPLEDDSLYFHHLVAGCQELMLTNPEALAFARELSEVEAVEKALQSMIDVYATPAKLTGLRDGDIVIAQHLSVRAARAALAPFKEPADV